MGRIENNTKLRTAQNFKKTSLWWARFSGPPPTPAHAFNLSRRRPPAAMASQVPKSILTHSQRVRRLYKAAVRTMQYQFDHRNFFLVERVVLRHRFDETKKEKDFRKLAAMLEEGEHEVWK